MKTVNALLILFAVLQIETCFSQNRLDTKEKFVAYLDSIANSQQFIENLAEFPGGNGDLYDYIIDNQNYSSTMQRKKIEGQVFVSFTVDMIDGHTRDAKVVKGINRRLDEEALRLVLAMPNWLQGKQRGRNVNVRINIPIPFFVD